MQLHELLQKVKAGLDEYASTNKAHLLLARDPFDVLEQLVGPVGGLRILVHYAGGQAEAHEFADIEGVYPLAREEIEVVVGTPIGSEAARDWRLVEGRGARAGLLERVDDLRALVLSLVFPDDKESHRRCAYLGCDPVTTPEGLPLAAYRLRFSLTCVVPIGADVELE